MKTNDILLKTFLQPMIQNIKWLGREGENHIAQWKGEVILLSGKIVASSLKNSTNQNTTSFDLADKRSESNSE